MTQPSAKNKKKKVTRREIAAFAGVSPSTVSRALAGSPLIPDSTKARIGELAKKHGYVPSSLARSFYQKKSFRIALVIPFSLSEGRVRTVPSEYFSKMLYGAVSAATEARFSLNVIADDGLSSASLAHEVLSHSVDGFIFLGGSIAQNDRFDELHRKNIPFVLVHHYVPGKPYISVDTDSESGLRELLKYFHDNGVRTIGFVTGGEQFVNAIDRKSLLMRLAGEYDCTVSKIVEGNFSRTSGRYAAEQFMKKPFPDAIVCANDRMAFGLIEEMKRNGIRIPDAVRVAGFDNQDVATLISPALTTIENPFYDVGRGAAEKLIALIGGKKVESSRLPSRLMVRESA
ncbi:MAG: LacI family DNA-binding transcriptional regulator [Spirochaetes bacterium]|nr:LacI family DNA-binding transcriptional regulator [Spirochaetota bacterium]